MLNKVQLIGNLGQDPESRVMQGSGEAVVSFSLATSEYHKDKQTGERKDRTEWHKCVAFGKTGDVVANYCRKGSKVYADGSIRTRKWTDKEGKDRYTTEIIVNDIKLLDPRPVEGQQYNGIIPPASQPARAPEAAPAGGFDAFDDDIPF